MNGRVESSPYHWFRLNADNWASEVTEMNNLLDIPISQSSGKLPLLYRLPLHPMVLLCSRKCPLYTSLPALVGVPPILGTARGLSYARMVYCRNCLGNMWVMGFCHCQLQANLHGNGPGEAKQLFADKTGQLFQFVNFRERGPQKSDKDAKLWLQELEPAG